MSRGQDNDRKRTIVLMGKESATKTEAADHLLGKNHFARNSKCERKESERYVVINVPDLFDGDTPDQNIIDCMALSYPGPLGFLLVIHEPIKAEEISNQVNKLQETFGEEVIAHMAVVVPRNSDLSNLHLTTHLHFCDVGNVQVYVDKWFDFNRSGFLYTYNDYSTAVVERRRAILMDVKRNAHYDSSRYCHESNPERAQRVSYVPDSHRRNAPESSRIQEDSATSGAGSSHTLNIVLLGQTGTGKSASGNTILTKDSFPSRASSVTVTKECAVEAIDIFGTQIKVIDTPDFFNEDVDNVDKHIKECRKHCQTGPCVYLLILEVGRFTDGEREILKNLEAAFESDIRRNAIILFTHGENLKRDGLTPEKFVKQVNPHLKKIMEQCGNRHHVFQNSRKDWNQVKQLLRKIKEMPGLSHLFPDENSFFNSWLDVFK